MPCLAPVFRYMGCAYTVDVRKANLRSCVYLVHKIMKRVSMVTCVHVCVYIVM